MFFFFQCYIVMQLKEDKWFLQTDLNFQNQMETT